MSAFASKFAGRAQYAQPMATEGFLSKAGEMASQFSGQTMANIGGIKKVAGAMIMVMGAASILCGGPLGVAGGLAIIAKGAGGMALGQAMKGLGKTTLEKSKPASERKGLLANLGQGALKPW